MVYYSRGEMADRDVAIVVNKSIMRIKLHGYTVRQMM